MKATPFIKIIIAAVLWGACGVMVKILNLPAAVLTFYRLFIPTIFLFLYFLIKKNHIFKKNNPVLLSASLLNCIRIFLFFIAMNLTSVGNSVVMLYTWPIFVMILSVILLKEKINILKVCLFITVLIGIVMIYIDKKFSFQDKDFLGMSIMLASSLLNSITLIIFKKQSENLTGLELTFFQNSLGGFIALPFLFIDFKPILYNQLFGVIFYSFLTGVIGYALFFSAMKEIKATTASFFSFLEVPSGIIFGVLILKEKITWNFISGAIIIILSVVIMRVIEYQKNINKALKNY